jgi:hypothetical protein
MADRKDDGDEARRLAHGPHIEMVFGGITLFLSRKYVESRCVKNGLFEGVALTAIIGT